MRSQIRHILIMLCLGTTIVAGGVLLTDYSARPGGVGRARYDLGALGPLKTDGRRIVVVSVHPHCPCTAATARQLERLAVYFPRTTHVLACVYCPTDAAAEWVASSTTDVLRRIPRSRIILDRGGEISASLGARTSGHIFYYDATGRLTFSGGITPGRGHEGSCDASADLLKRTRGLQGFGSWPVFGCQLFSKLPELP